jgi:hypothetical protein
LEYNFACISCFRSWISFAYHLHIINARARARSPYVFYWAVRQLATKKLLIDLRSRRRYFVAVRSDSSER